MVEMARIQQLSDEIARKYHPDKIILFGSYAYGNPTEDSDVDLLVVLPFEGRPLAKSVEIMCDVLPSPYFPVDLLARTPAEVWRRYTQYNPVIREALDRGRVLYERGS